VNVDELAMHLRNDREPAAEAHDTDVKEDKEHRTKHHFSLLSIDEIGSIAIRTKPMFT
jgi:hypothetical protein